MSEGEGAWHTRRTIVIEQFSEDKPARVTILGPADQPIHQFYAARTYVNILVAVLREIHISQTS